MLKSTFALALIGLCMAAVSADGDITQFTVKDLDNKDVDFKQFKGNCLLIINTASGCGFTSINMNFLNRVANNSDYAGVQVVAFPSNSFGQEKKSEEELKNWFSSEWKAKYAYYNKVDVFESPIYKFLIQQSGEKVKWNYGKYVVEKDGKTVTVYGPQRTDNIITDLGFTKHLKKCGRA